MKEFLVPVVFGLGVSAVALTLQPTGDDLPQKDLLHLQERNVDCSRYDECHEDLKCKMPNDKDIPNAW